MIKDQERRTMSNDNTQDEATPSPASAGSRPFAWAADIPGKFGAAPTVLFGYTEKLVQRIAAAGGDLVQPFPLYRQPQPTLTDEAKEIQRLITVCESYALSSAAACRDIKRLHARCEELENSLRFLGKAAAMMATEGETPHREDEQSPAESASLSSACLGLAPGQDALVSRPQ